MMKASSGADSRLGAMMLPMGGMASAGAHVLYRGERRRPGWVVAKLTAHRVEDAKGRDERTGPTALDRHPRVSGEEDRKSVIVGEHL